MWALEIVVLYVLLEAWVSPSLSFVASVEAFYFAYGGGPSFAGDYVLYSFMFQVFGEVCFSVFLPGVELYSLVGEDLLWFSVLLYCLF